MQDYKTNLDFQMMHLARANIYLGKESLYNLGLSLNHNNQDNSLEFSHEDRQVKVQGESHIMTAALISSVELGRAIRVDDIEHVYIVTHIHSFLFAVESVNYSSALNHVFIVEMVNESVFESNKQKQCLGGNPCFYKLVLIACENNKTKVEIKKTCRYATILSSLLSKFGDVFLDDLPDVLP